MDAQDAGQHEVTEKRLSTQADLHRVGLHEVWTIVAVDDQPILEGRQTAAEMTVTVSLNGWPVKQFTYPSYRIWTLLAHWTEGLAELDTSVPTVVDGERLFEALQAIEANDSVQEGAYGRASRDAVDLVSRRVLGRAWPRG